jgi:hypothetical protein
MNIIKSEPDRLTVEDAAKLLGLKSFDTALPQTWLDDVLFRMSVANLTLNPKLPENWKDIILSGIVWCYDPTADGKPALFGYPVALTVKTIELLNLACPRNIWDFSLQAIAIETRETYVIEGVKTYLEVILANNLEQAIGSFLDSHPDAKITSATTRNLFKEKHNV